LFHHSIHPLPDSILLQRNQWMCIHLVAGLFDINKRIIGNIGLGVSQKYVARHHDH
jgi:hypothetical protein